MTLFETLLPANTDALQNILTASNPRVVRGLVSRSEQTPLETRARERKEKFQAPINKKTARIEERKRRIVELLTANRPEEVSTQQILIALKLPSSSVNSYLAQMRFAGSIRCARRPGVNRSYYYVYWVE